MISGRNASYKFVQRLSNVSLQSEITHQHQQPANRTFRQGCFPGKFKSAVVKPLLKKQGLDVNPPSNYIPISNLNNISKILERLFLSRLNSHVIKSPHSNHLQSAYRKMHSCETALCKTLNDIYLSSDNGKCTILISLVLHLIP